MAQRAEPVRRQRPPCGAGGPCLRWSSACGHMPHGGAVRACMLAGQKGAGNLESCCKREVFGKAHAC